MHDPALDAEEPHVPPWRVPAGTNAAVAGLILAVTAGSLAFFYSLHLTNLYGDGLAHVEGARRIFDSMTPGYAEIGSVWLPLYHLICAPLATNDFLWRTGLAGSIVSSLAFAAACYFLFHLGAEMNGNVAAGLVALAGALLCPSLLYLAATPLTEPLAILWTVLTVFALFRYSQSGSRRTLGWAAVSAFLGTLTRYEGWNLVPFATVAVFLISSGAWRQRLVRSTAFAAVAGSGPLLWLLHNAYRFKNPLEFYNGPYSARAIYSHQLATTAFAYPTDGSWLLSIQYYLEDLKLVIGVWPLELAALGLVAWCVNLRESRRAAVACLLLVPLPFYIQAMAYAAVPLYVPTLFPHTYYNLRYGLEMIPAVALFPSFIFSVRLHRPLRLGLLALFVAVLGYQSARMLSSGPEALAVVKEGILNTPCRSPRQEAIIQYLRGHYDGRRVLVAVGKWPCVMPQVGISFHNTISDSNRKYWGMMKTDPQDWVGWIIRGNGDAIDHLMQTYPKAFTDFEVVAQGSYRDEGDFRIYRRAKP
jgi:hypothetical protein